jgi:hypothetical protein
MKNIPLQLLLRKVDYKMLHDITKEIKITQDEEYKRHLKEVQKSLIGEIMNYWQDSETINTVLNSI